MKEKSEKPYTIQEAAEYLGLATSFLYKLTSQKKISFFKPNGGKIYFTQNDLDAYLFRNRQLADFEVEKQAETFLFKR